METNNQLGSLDLLVIGLYLGGMILLGIQLSRGQRSDEDYFLAGRRMPWFAVGMSVIASLLSTMRITYVESVSQTPAIGVSRMMLVLGL